ncbi:hypothetical protein EYZ11_003092 [Aspergillus tanneri]|uniref:Uncharacterized protein n=1 Tax=Aspergillus tanneri TaxID=1220188 RepID=A0A4S3JP37_9EURO|nr:hypothetical protein EYZ11_003092 [Aspergillus tanneri]
MLMIHHIEKYGLYLYLGELNKNG